MKTTPLFILLLLTSFLAVSCCRNANKEEWAIVIHGGAGSGRSMTPEAREKYLDLLDQVLDLGTGMLENGAEALDVVTQVVVWMEDCPDFNAGKGAVITSNGMHELDAALMDGRDLQAGAVAGVRDIKNPILAARHVMEDSPHVLLIGEGASSFARSMGLTMVENSYFSTPKSLEQIKRIKEKKEAPDPKGTVGCVALDRKGNLAAATSTGGMSGKRWGRVGDVPVIGAGTYANNSTVAVSGTGHGELWIRRCVAFDISALIDYKGFTVEEAARKVIFDKIDKMEGSGGGVICVDKNGNIAMEFNTDIMYRAWATASGQHGVAIEH
ncbi:MAG TPA: isoaspartyl peptidase/L-asparaginase [Bacteroidales bacterium]|nr:isoaspartyl peptidase/L-asparaginase [Bacteroidales bacterium]HQB56658.1 isoaspartyl peptidase/L-asparaginase [Bacteroidales bacterium]